MKSRISLSLSGVVILIILGWWLVAYRNSPQQAFWDMLSNNLSTQGVTRVVSQSGTNVQVTQYTQLSLGARPLVHSLTVFKQNDGTLVTEEISNRSTDYVRYQKIADSKGGVAITKIQKLVGKWARLEGGSSLGSSLTSGLFEQSILGVLPIGNLQPTSRGELLSTMHNRHVFTFDTHEVKRTIIAGRAAYQYAVSVSPAAYIAMMQQFEKLVGATTYSHLKPANYTSAANIKLIIDVDMRSHQLLQLAQDGSGRVETYQGFGIVDKTPLPTALLTTSQLTQQLVNLEAQAQ